jgi:hypothetical protein
VLPGVNERLTNGTPAERGHDRRDFHQIGTGAGDVEDVHDDGAYSIKSLVRLS